MTREALLAAALRKAKEAVQDSAALSEEQFAILRTACFTEKAQTLALAKIILQDAVDSFEDDET